MFLSDSLRNRPKGLSRFRKCMVSDSVPPMLTSRGPAGRVVALCRERSASEISARRCADPVLAYKRAPVISRQSTHPTLFVSAPPPPLVMPRGGLVAVFALWGGCETAKLSSLFEARLRHTSTNRTKKSIWLGLNAGFCLTFSLSLA